MRRKDKEITSEDEILRIIQNARICHVAFHDEKYPYIVPLCYGFDHQGNKKSLYFHVAKSGKKLDLIMKNPHVAFEIERDLSLFAVPELCGLLMMRMKKFMHYNVLQSIIPFMTRTKNTPAQWIRNFIMHILMLNMCKVLFYLNLLLKVGQEKIPSPIDAPLMLCVDVCIKIRTR